MPLQTIGPPLDPASVQAPGNMLTSAQRVRDKKDDWNFDVAQIAESTQRQLDHIHSVLSAKPPSLIQINVTDASGALIGWFGTRTYGSTSYAPLWVSTLYFGGTGPDNGVSMTADATGHITLNAVSLTLNGHLGFTGDITFGAVTGVHVQGGIIYGTF